MKPLIIDISILDEQDRKIVMHAEVPIAIVKYKKSFFAFDNRCPHRGGALYKGKMKNTIITCPLHKWKFNLESGFCINNNKIRIKKFKVNQVKNKLIIDCD